MIDRQYLFVQEMGPSVEDKGEGLRLVLRGERYRVGHAVFVDPSRCFYTDNTFQKRFQIDYRAPKMEEKIKEVGAKLNCSSWLTI